MAFTIWISLGLIALMVLLAYAGLLWYYRPPKSHFTTATDQSSLAFVSVLIPARNEEDNIAFCLNSILAQNYPKDSFEIIVIDDHSEDGTAQIVRKYSDNHPQVRLLQLADFLAGKQPIAYKKAALHYGVQEAKGSLILSTDADCTYEESWLYTMASVSGDLCLGPVQFQPVNNLLSAFQALDMAGVMQLTAGSAARGQALLANGANLCFQKKLFEKINGYQGIDNLASGDDVLLLQKVKNQSAGSIFFVDSPKATVYTKTEKTWKSLWFQRLRWASKTSVYTDHRLILVQGISFMLCCLCLLSLIAPFFSFDLGILLLVGLWLTKFLIDYWWLKSATHRYGATKWLNWLPIVFVLHTVYVAMIGLASFVPVKKSWKGRSS